MAEYEKEAKRSKTPIVNIRSPMKQDYKFVPTKYEPGRPILSWDKLRKVPAGIKKIHDWYMRTASIGINTINLNIPPKAFNSDHERQSLPLRTCG